MAFNLGNDEGFRWIDGYDSITADELLCGGTNETKTGAAEDLIRDMLSSGEYVPSERIYERAKEKDISPRTVTEAKAKIKGITTKKIGKAWHWAILENADCTE